VYSKEEKKQLIVNFWIGFSEYCNNQGYLCDKHKKWLLHKTNVNNVHLKFNPGHKGVDVILEIQHKSEIKRLEMYERIKQYEVILEEGFPYGLIWDFAFVRDAGQEVCRIYTELKEVDINNQSQWDDMYQFMADNMYRMENNFIEIRELIKD
jgi:hypothetical protein